MDILQLCCFSNFYPAHFNVENWELTEGRDILKMPCFYGTKFDLIVCAPPCDQFTKANQNNRQAFPAHNIALVKKCLQVCLGSGKPWVIENPPGRLENFVPELKKYRVITWRSHVSNKEHVLYSNFLIVQPLKKRYGSHLKVGNLSRKQRLFFEPSLISDIINSLNPGHS